MKIILSLLLLVIAASTSMAALNSDTSGFSPKSSAVYEYVECELAGTPGAQESLSRFAINIGYTSTNGAVIIGQGEYSSMSTFSDIGGYNPVTISRVVKSDDKTITLELSRVYHDTYIYGITINKETKTAVIQGTSNYDTSEWFNYSDSYTCRF